jgi:hypothetical protein
MVRFGFQPFVEQLLCQCWGIQKRCGFSTTWNKIVAITRIYGINILSLQKNALILKKCNSFQKYSSL